MRRLAYGAICFLLGAAATAGASRLPYTAEEFNRQARVTDVWVAVRNDRVIGAHIDVHSVRPVRHAAERAAKEMEQRHPELARNAPVAEFVQGQIVLPRR